MFFILDRNEIGHYEGHAVDAEEITGQEKSFALSKLKNQGREPYPAAIKVISVNDEKSLSVFEPILGALLRIELATGRQMYLYAKDAELFFDVANIKDIIFAKKPAAYAQVENKVYLEFMEQKRTWAQRITRRSPPSTIVVMDKEFFDGLYAPLPSERDRSNVVSIGKRLSRPL